MVPQRSVDLDDLFRVLTPAEDDEAYILEITSSTILPHLDSMAFRDFTRREYDSENLQYHLEDTQALVETQSGRHICYARHLSQKD